MQSSKKIRTKETRKAQWFMWLTVAWMSHCHHYRHPCLKCIIKFGDIRQHRNSFCKKHVLQQLQSVWQKPQNMNKPDHFKTFVVPRFGWAGHENFIRAAPRDKKKKFLHLFVDIIVHKHFMSLHFSKKLKRYDLTWLNYITLSFMVFHEKNPVYALIDKSEHISNRIIRIYTVHTLFFE